MKKLLRTQDVLLLGLAGALDVYYDLKDPFGTVGNAYKNLYGWVPKRFKKTNFYQTVYHSLRTGYLEKVIKNGEVYLRLTTKGKEEIQREFSFVQWQGKKWDRKWRIVIFDIKERKRNQRDQLRKKLKELGFGMIQESVWITPYDLALDFREFVKNIGLGENVFVMEVSHLLAGQYKSLVAKIWPLEKLNKSYKELFYVLTNLHDRVKSSIDRNELGQVEEEQTQACRAYLEILREDPCLPRELLPEGWFGEKVKRLIFQNFKVK